MSHNVVGMSPKEKGTELFAEMISHVEGSGNPLKHDQVSLNPVAECKLSDIYVTGARCWFPRVCHGDGSIIVFVCDGCSNLWNPEVPEDAPNV